MGLSPNGGMPGSDIVIGWVKDGTAYLTDRYADAKAEPSVDESQDWELVSGYENGTHTVLRFNRKLTTCDENDRVITEDTLRVIWAWHDQDPEDESGVSGPSYHGSNRGARATRLLSRKYPDQTNSAGTTYTVDFIMNKVNVPDYQDTTYWCQVFEMPKLVGKHHVIKAEPIIQPGNEGMVHHFLVYNCKKNPNMTICQRNIRDMSVLLPTCLATGENVIREASLWHGPSVVGVSFTQSRLVTPSVARTTVALC
ncbi:DBH-like monooxygenase protein 1 isoform X2 [Branchiostoma floridae]|uniref:DBH-like monooxygenase protein 1 isoform X2 n=1 Tax=Branchiostoma floridae TaxID=7739 RepID=A0A9J7LUK8_BRAFL|nr:DBH-like monooxygenase protein 1 isoform X2 [Branchiostoma floridae]